MAVRSRVNQYRGINAHLHSYFQKHGGWDSFHANHISDLAEAINDKLPQGYLVDIEQSLQIREFHPDTGERIMRRPKPDLTIYDTDPRRSRSFSQPSSGTAATLTQPVIETIRTTTELFYSALLIYQVEESENLGRAITRIEVLSPTNKIAGEGNLQYVQKRYAALKTGLRLVEIDYLHETQSPIQGIPIYPQQDTAYPYNITVNDPNPSLEEGVSTTYGFGVDDVIPAIPIPLTGDETLLLDFNPVYNRTFHKLNAYSYRVDYEQLPENFDRYNLLDQTRIKRRMQIVLDAQSRGLKLEDGPFES